MPLTVDHDDLFLAIDFVSSQGVGENHAFLCKETGKIYWRSDLNETEELPEDIEDARKYIAIPDKRELDLGKPLVLAFVREILPDDLDEVRAIFSRRGAYSRFRALLARRGAVDRWHQFEAAATEQAIREWCESNSIALEKSAMRSRE